MVASTSAKSLAGLIVLISFAARGQFLPVNESGRCEIEQVVVADSLSRAMLYTNAKQWFKSVPSVDVKTVTVAMDSLEGTIGADVEALVYSQSGILRKLSGSITYHIRVDAKDGKYRYNFSSFVFHYYAQNRNYETVKTGKTKPLEESKASGWQKLWTQHRRTIATLTTNQIKCLRIKMIEVQRPAKSDGKKVDW